MHRSVGRRCEFEMLWASASLSLLISRRGCQDPLTGLTACFSGLEGIVKELEGKVALGKLGRRGLWSGQIK